MIQEPIAESTVGSIKPMTGRLIFFKAFLLSLCFVVIMLLVTALIFAGFGYHKYNQFLKSAGISGQEFQQTIKTGWSLTSSSNNNHKNILILGVDTLTTRGNSLPLTDTMMLASIDFKSGQITTLPLLRDLWHADYQTKINALYTYGIDRYPENPEKFPQEVIAELIGLPIHHALVISMEQVAEIVDLIGGIEVEITHNFIDEKFPRSDVDVTTTTDPKKLYETIEFKTGTQLMNGSTALKYMRSRHGDNDQNTDEARSKRQQVVINSLMRKMLNRETLAQTTLLGQLYQIYLNDFSKNISPEELIATSKALLPLRNQITLINQSLDIYPDEKLGTIEHPPQYLYDGQWVYTIRNQQDFKNEVQQKLLDQTE